MWTLANSSARAREGSPRVPDAGAWPRTSSPTTATGRTSSTSARPGGWSRDYVMTEHDCRGRRKADGLRSGWAPTTWTRTTSQRYVDADGHVRNEGDVQVGGSRPIRSATGRSCPRPASATNLLVPVCLSASHIAYGSIRMEPVFMVLGQSAATAAAMAIDGGTTVQKVDYAALRKRLARRWAGARVDRAGAARGGNRSEDAARRGGR